MVTGKLDVRGAAANLPDEANEPLPLDDPDLAAEIDEDVDDAREEAEA